MLPGNLFALPFIPVACYRDSEYENSELEKLRASMIWDDGKPVIEIKDQIGLKPEYGDAGE